MSHTEFNALSIGELAYMEEILRSIHTDEERRNFIAGNKAHLIEVFAKKQSKTIMDIIIYLANVFAIAKVEGVQIDCAQLSAVPCVPLFIGLTNYMGRYVPTPEWYAEFKEKIDTIEELATKSTEPSIETLNQHGNGVGGFGLYV